MTSAAIYARVSSARQKKDQTIGSQTQALREHAAQNRLEVPEEWVFEDEGHSGATLVRPALEALRDWQPPIRAGRGPRCPLGGGRVGVDRPEGSVAPRGRAGRAVLIPRNSRRTKIAIDYLHREWRGNAVGFASYGRGAAGIRAVQALKQAVRGTTPPFGLRLSIFPNGGG